MRIGNGYDVHKLVCGRKLILGGVDIPYEKGLLGHSDADVLLHAIMDALLGAAALRDIGYHFPDNDPEYKDISSIELLKRTAELIKEAVAEYYDVPLSSILSQRRDKEVVVPRQVAMYLCHSMLSLPYKKTADIFGRSDHSTVINACKKINDRLEQDEAFRRTLEDIQSRLT